MYRKADAELNFSLRFLGQSIKPKASGIGCYWAISRLRYYFIPKPRSQPRPALQRSNNPPEGTGTKARMLHCHRAHVGESCNDVELENFKQFRRARVLMACSVTYSIVCRSNQYFGRVASRTPIDKWFMTILDFCAKMARMAKMKLRKNGFSADRSSLDPSA